MKFDLQQIQEIYKNHKKSVLLTVILSILALCFIGYNRYQAHLKELADTKHTASLLEQEREFKYKSLIGSNSIGFSINEVDNSLVVPVESLEKQGIFKDLANSFVKGIAMTQEQLQRFICAFKDDNTLQDAVQLPDNIESFFNSIESFSYSEKVISNNHMLTINLQFKLNGNINISNENNQEQDSHRFETI